MIQNPTVPTKDDPQLLDLLLDEMAGKLLTALSWLDNAYGKAERLVKYGVLNRPEFKPAIFVGGRLGQDYLYLLPDAHLGCFSWFDVPNVQSLQFERRGFKRVSTSVGLIFWFDFTKVYPNDHQTRTIENVKADVLEAIRTMTLTNGAIRIQEIHERTDEIYRGYTTNEVDRQFLMRPYSGFRINMEVQVNESC